jgi:membrane protease YdiL (CAAX protease family)
MIRFAYRVLLFGFCFVLASYLGRLVVCVLIAAYRGVDYESILAIGALKVLGELNACNKWVILAANAGASVGGFIIWPVLYILYVEADLGLKRRFDYKGDKSAVGFTAIVALFVCLLVFNSLFIDLLYEVYNSVPVPRCLQSLYRQTIERHEELRSLLFCFADVGSVYELFLVVLTLCVVPAVGEELLFRGILQDRLCGTLCKDSVCVLLVSVLFALVHFDWLGFVPRVLLSVFLGYVYIVCGDLRVPMFFHFVNNVVAVMYAYFKVKGGI